MARTTRAFFALLLALLCLPVFAADDCPSIQGLAANDADIEQPVTITWSYAGGVPQSQTLTGHDFAQPVVIPAGQTSYTYTPTMPGEKHVQLAAATSCGTVTAEAKYHVKQCTIATPALTLDRTSVEPGATINASIVLAPGHTAVWQVRNGTASATDGAAISIVAGQPGNVEIDVFVSRGSSCTVKVSGTVAVVNPCVIAEHQIVAPAEASQGGVFAVFVPQVEAGVTVTFEVKVGTKLFADAQAVIVVAPSSGNAEVDVILTKSPTCSVRISKVIPTFVCAPKAVVSALPNASCDNMTVVAEFTGTAPFQGYWSDGTHFFTTQNRLERKVAEPGVYSINFFQDRFCAGQPSGQADFTQVTRPVGSVAAAGSSCAPKVLVTFTGTPPFTATWLDNNETFTTSSHTYERLVTQPGWYQLANVRDASCSGLSGSPVWVNPPTQVGQPYFQIIDRPDLGYFTCSGTPRTAKLIHPVPEGYQPVWSLQNGTIISGQGTDTLVFSGNQPGSVSITAFLQSAEGCVSAPYTDSYMTVQSTPRVVSMTVTPAAGGQNPRLTVTIENAWGVTLESSIGGTFPYIDQPAPNVYVYDFYPNGASGLATITARAHNACGASEPVTATVEIRPAAPTAYVSATGTDCLSYRVRADLSGTPPFRGTWSDGTPFTSDYSIAELRPRTPGTYTIASFTDATGTPGVVNGSATFNFTQPTATLSVDGSSCANKIVVTFTGTAPFQFRFADEPYYYGIMESTYTRYVEQPGTYSLAEFNDATWCSGTIGAPVTVTPTQLAVPDFTFDVASICNGQTATATLTSPLPAGAEVYWNVWGGDVVSGQGTQSVVLRANGTAYGIYVYAFVNGGGCTAQSPQKHLPPASAPAAPQVTADSTYLIIGQAATFTVQLGSPTDTLTFENTLGDTMEVIGTPAPGTYTVCYTSGKATGYSLIRFKATSACGETTESLVSLDVAQPQARLSAVGGIDCGNAKVVVEFRGTPPFSGTWEDGSTFSTNEYRLERVVTAYGTYSITQFRDAIAEAGWIEPYYGVYIGQAPVARIAGTTITCPGVLTHAFLEAGIPAGGQIIWSIENGTIVDGQGTTHLSYTMASPAPATIGVTITYPDGCAPATSTMVVQPGGEASATVTVAPESIRAGETANVSVTMNQWVSGWGVMTSNGDPLENFDCSTWPTCTFLYRSLNGPGTSTIRVFGNDSCMRTFESTATLTINP